METVPLHETSFRRMEGDHFPRDYVAAPLQSVSTTFNLYKCSFFSRISHLGSEYGMMPFFPFGRKASFCLSFGFSLSEFLQRLFGSIHWRYLSRLLV